MICFGVLAGIPAIICGHIARNRAKSLPAPQPGSGKALAGLILGYVSVAFTFLILPAMLLPALSKAREKANIVSCMSNMRQINVRIIMYAGDNSDHLPSATNWCDVLLPYGKDREIFRCGLGDPAQPAHCAINSRVAGIRTSEVHDASRTVLVFETDTSAAGWNRSGGRELMTETRHGNAFLVGFVDGHVEAVRRQNLSKLLWDP